MEFDKLSKRDRVANRIEDGGTDRPAGKVRGVGGAPRKGLGELSR